MLVAKKVIVQGQSHSNSFTLSATKEVVRISILHKIAVSVIYALTTLTEVCKD